MRILMDIIHGRTRRVPKTIDLDTLAKISVLVDCYDCVEVVEMVSDIWIKELEQSVPKTYCREAVL